MYAQKPVTGRTRDRAPYVTLRQMQTPSCGCAEDAPVLATPCRPTPGCLEGMPLAMVYAPKQAFENIYPPEQWLDKGTVFAALDFPFRGGRKGR